MRKYKKCNLNIHRKQFVRVPVLCILIATCVFMTVGCKGFGNTETKKEEKEEVLVVSPEEETDERKEGTFFNRSEEKTKVSKAKELGGSKTLEIVESEQKEYPEEEETEIVTTWIPGIW